MDGETRSLIPFDFRGIPLESNHSFNNYINNLTTTCHFNEFLYKDVRMLPTDNSEVVYFSEYFEQQQIRNKQKLTSEKTALCICSICTEHVKTPSAPNPPLILPAPASIQQPKTLQSRSTPIAPKPKPSVQPLVPMTVLETCPKVSLPMNDHPTSPYTPYSTLVNGNHIY